MKKILLQFVLLFFVMLPYARAAEETPVELKQVGIEEQLGNRLSDFSFINEVGDKVLLKDYLTGEKPVLLNLVYYGCPSLCTFVLNGIVDGLNGLKWNLGENFNLLTISIHPQETIKLAQEKKQAYVKTLNPELQDAANWHFWLSPDNQVKKLADELGFRYNYDEEQGEYAHASAIFVLTPDGKISRYLYGINYPARDLRLALVEAGEGKIGSVVDKFLLFCYHYDPKGRRYALIATNAMKLGGGITVLGVLGLLGGLTRKKRKTC